MLASQEMPARGRRDNRVVHKALFWVHTVHLALEEVVRGLLD